jgi:uncharacterized membrane protein
MKQKIAVFMVLTLLVSKAATNEDVSLNAMAMTFVYAVILMIFSSIVLYLVYGKKPWFKSDKTKV